MRPWLLLATRNWRANPGRAAATLTAVALGVATVVWVTCSYESVRRSLSDQVVEHWVGRSHLSVESPLGHWGSIRESMISVVRRAEGVTYVTPRLRRRMFLNVDGFAETEASLDLRSGEMGLEIDAVGIDPRTEYQFRTFDVVGRRLEPNDRGVAVVEADLARAVGLEIGDTMAIELYPGAVPLRLRIIGVHESRRVAKFQRPMVFVHLVDLQHAAVATGQLSTVDAMIADPTPANLERSAEAIRRGIAESNLGYQVTTARARLNQLNEAQDHTEFVLMLVSSVALLTAFFIILTTVNVGFVERIRQLGLLRCVGMTQGQIAWLVVGEAVPPGFAGIGLGIPIGLGLASLGGWLAPEYVSGLAVSVRGIVFAACAGALTVVGGALLPALQAARVSPLVATRPLARPTGNRLAPTAAVIGLVLVIGHELMVRWLVPTAWVQPIVAIIGTAALYSGYALVAPLAVRAVGGAAVQIVARVIRLRPALVNDQIGRSAWRGAGICCGLMVGLSLLIGVVVHSASVQSGWDFPKRLAEAFVWSHEPVTSDYAEIVRGIPGVKQCTVVNDFLCDVGEKKSGLFGMFGLKSTFVAGEPGRFLDMTRLEFLEGDAADARRKLLSGGYILVPPEASRAFGLHLGDRTVVSAAGRSAEFEVAGVVQSPALDIAVTYFQADSYMMMAAAGSVLGTLDDAKKYFSIDGITLFLLNLDLPQTEPPPPFDLPEPPAADDRAIARGLLDWGDRLTHDRDEIDLLRPRLERWLALPEQPPDAPYLVDSYRYSLKTASESWSDTSPQERWELFCDQLIMRRVVWSTGRPGAIFGSLRQLKQRIDRDIEEATVLLAAIPIVALIVASLGVGNLMMANVLNRTRQIAVLRSTGATRGQIARLVLAEAIVLGMIGAGAGLLLGIHAAGSMNELTERLIGFAPRLELPWFEIAVGIGITVGICVLAGIIPALCASRSNIIDAMRAG